METGNKRTASSPLSEGEEHEDLQNRRSRLKRINLDELVNQMESRPTVAGANAATGTSETVQHEQASAGDDSGKDIPPETSLTEEETPITLKILSGKIDKILNYLATNKDELSSINNRHEARFKFLESAHNDVVDKLGQTSVDIAKNATEIARNVTNIESNEACISTIKAQLRICRATNEEYISKFKDMEVEMKSLKSEVAENKRETLDLGLEVRERRLALSGVQEQDGEDCVTVAMAAINKILTHALNQQKTEHKSKKSKLKLRVLKAADFDQVYRLGRQKGKWPRVLILTFSFIYIRQMVLSAKPYMKNLDVKYYLNEDLTQAAKNHRANLKTIAEGGRSLGHDTKITGNKIVIDSETYLPDEMGAVSPTIMHAAKREKILENGIAFKGDRSIFSNFFPSPIIIDDTDYVSVEQYFQQQKAIHCGTESQVRKIMNKTNPWYIKTVGKRIEPSEEWNKMRLKILYTGISAKFEQNAPLRQALLNTAGLNLYEATTDLFYACGIDLDSPKWLSGDWPGQNATGQILMKVRSELLAEESLTDSVSDNTLMNLSSSQEIDDEDPSSKEASLTDSHDVSVMETETAEGDNQIPEWPALPQATSFTEVVKLSTSASSNARADSQMVPKLTKSHPQFTQNRGRTGTTHQRHQRHPKHQFPAAEDKMSAEDLAFLQVTNRTKSYHQTDRGNYPKTQDSRPNKGKSKANRRQKNTTSTPNKLSALNKSSELSPPQRAAIKHLGMHPDSQFVKAVSSSHNKRK